MELHNENGVHLQNGTATEHKAHQNGVSHKDNGKAEKTKPTQVKEEKPGIKPEVPEVQQVKVETKPIPQVLNLEATLKAVDTLHRKSVQRLNLISRLKQIEAFEVELLKESDQLEDNPYQGCKLIIEDDKHRQFVTRTPGLIRLVSQFIFNACNEKLVEIEAGIVFPNA